MKLQGSPDSNTVDFARQLEVTLSQKIAAAISANRHKGHRSRGHRTSAIRFRWRRSSGNEC